MKRQLDLLHPSGLGIKTEPGRTEPRLWVRRLVLWKDQSEKLREIELRPGLNIIWSPDPAEQEPSEQGKRSLGHGSGKTLLCRLLRYCLGEDRFAPEGQRSRIAQVFPKGAVGAEIVLDGTVWAILRPIGMARHHYAIPGGNLDRIIAGEVEPTGIEPFLAAAESGILSDDVAALVPGDRSFHGWLTALAWLARDQECRFGDLLEWRSSASDSDSPARSLSSTKRLEALRALIGAIAPEEVKLREKIALLETKHREAGLEIGHRNWEASKAKSRLISQLGFRRDEVPSGRLAVDVFRKAAKEGLAKVAAINADTDVADLDALRVAYEAAERRANDLKNELGIIEALMPEIERLISSMKGELPGLSFSIHKADNPQCPICEVPIDRALAEGCMLSHKLPNAEEIRARRESLQKEIGQESNRLQQLRERHTFLNHELPDAREEADAMKSRVRSAEQARDARAEAWYSARRLIDEAGRLDDRLAELEDMQSRAEKLTEKMEGKREQAAAFRNEQAKVLRRLSQIFDAIIQEFAGADAGGKVTLDGNGLRLSVELGGERSTPAIDSLKVIAFDLAALCMSIEGRTHIPTFLIHDSPREADLGLSAYHQLFRFARDLEQVGENPAFQYIVTTTTRPPTEVLMAPCLRETLKGAPAEARLLRRDL